MLGAAGPVSRILRRCSGQQALYSVSGSDTQAAGLIRTLQNLWAGRGPVAEIWLSHEEDRCVKRLKATV